MSSPTNKPTEPKCTQSIFLDYDRVAKTTYGQEYKALDVAKQQKVENICWGTFFSMPTMKRSASAPPSLGGTELTSSNSNASQA